MELRATDAPEKRIVAGSTVVTSKVGVPMMATGTVPCDFRLITLGVSPGLMSTITGMAFGRSPTIVENRLTPVKVAARPPASTRPVIGLFAASMAGVRLPVAGSTRNNPMPVPGIT